MTGQGAGAEPSLSVRATVLAREELARWRQRLRTPVDCLVVRFIGQQPDESRAPVRNVLDPHVKPRRDMYRAPFAEFAARVDHGFVLPVGVGSTEEEDFRGSARITSSEQSCAEDTGRVDGDRVAGWDERGEISEAPVLEGA